MARETNDWAVSIHCAIGRDCEAMVLVRGQVTAEMIDRLIKNLELTRDTYPVSAEPVPSEEADA